MGTKSHNLQHYGGDTRSLNTNAAKCSWDDFGNDSPGRLSLPNKARPQAVQANPGTFVYRRDGREGTRGTRGPMSAERRGASRMGSRGTPSAGAPRLRTDLHSPAGVRPKFRHSLEHIVPGKEPRPPGKELRPAGSPLPSTGPARAPGVQAGAGRVTWAARARGGGGRTATSSTRAASGSAIQPRGGRAERKEPGRPRRVRSARWPRARSAHAQGCCCREPVREWSGGRKATETHHTTHFPKAVTMKDRFKEANVLRRTRGLERWLRGEEHWVLFRRS